MPVEEQELIRQRRGEQGQGGERGWGDADTLRGEASRGEARRPEEGRGQVWEMFGTGRAGPWGVWGEGTYHKSSVGVWVKSGALPPPGESVSGPSLCFLPFSLLLFSKVRDSFLLPSPTPGASLHGPSSFLRAPSANNLHFKACKLPMSWTLC